MTKTSGIRRTGRLLALAVAASIAVLPLAPPAASHPAKQNKLAGMVNTYRQDKGLNKLTHNDVLRKKAHKQAKKIAEAGALSHSTTTQMINYMKAVNCSVIAENVGYHGKTVWGVHETFKASSAHNSNLLNPSWKKMGIGVHLDGKGWVWATQIFCA